MSPRAARPAGADGAASRQTVGERIDAEQGQLGELDVDVRRIEHHYLAERAGVDEPQLGLPSSRCITTWVWGGRGAPAVATSSCPVIRRWIIISSPVSSGMSRYLPRRLAAIMVAPVNPSTIACADVRRTVRSRPISTRSTRRPTAKRGESPSHGLDLGQFGHASLRCGAGAWTVRRQRAGRRPPRRPPARRPSSSGPSPSPMTCAVQHDRGEEALGVIRTLRPHDVLGRRRPVAGRSSCRRDLWSSWSRRAAARQSRPDQPLDRLVGHFRPAVDVHGAEHGLEGVREDRRLLATAGRRPRPRRAAARAEPSSSATSARAAALTTPLRTTGQSTLGELGETPEGDVGHDPAEHRVAQELQALVARLTWVLDTHDRCAMARRSSDSSAKS